MLSARASQLNTDSAYFPTKTPGRNLKNRIENAGRPGAMTVNGKGKNGVSRTPFHPASTQAARLFKDPSISQTQGKPTIALRARPLVDKTPFPNRVGTHFQTPLTQTANFRKFSVFEPNTGTPEATLRPSSTRKHIRAPRSASKSFETPVNQGNHWDISDGSIVLPETQVQESTEETDDVDEIEYMAPNNLDLPYQPPFDFELPDYKVVGATLRDLAYSYPHDDSLPPEIDVKGDSILIPKWNFLPLPELVDDDPFSQARAELKSLSQNKSTLRTANVPKFSRAPSVTSTTTKTTIKGTSRPGTALSVATTTTATRKPLSRAPILRNTPITSTGQILAKTSNSTKIRLPSIPDRRVVPSVKRPLPSSSINPPTMGGRQLMKPLRSVQTQQGIQNLNALIKDKAALHLDVEDFIFEV